MNNLKVIAISSDKIQSLAETYLPKLERILSRLPEHSVTPDIQSYVTAMTVDVTRSESAHSFGVKDRTYFWVYQPLEDIAWIMYLDEEDNLRMYLEYDYPDTFTAQLQALHKHISALGMQVVTDIPECVLLKKESFEEHVKSLGSIGRSFKKNTDLTFEKVDVSQDLSYTIPATVDTMGLYHADKHKLVGYNKPEKGIEILWEHLTDKDKDGFPLTAPHFIPLESIWIDDTYKRSCNFYAIWDRSRDYCYGYISLYNLSDGGVWWGDTVIRRDPESKERNLGNWILLNALKTVYDNGNKYFSLGDGEWAYKQRWHPVMRYRPNALPVENSEVYSATLEVFKQARKDLGKYPE